MVHNGATWYLHTCKNVFQVLIFHIALAFRTSKLNVQVNDNLTFFYVQLPAHVNSKLTTTVGLQSILIEAVINELEMKWNGLYFSSSLMMWCSIQNHVCKENISQEITRLMTERNFRMKTLVKTFTNKSEVDVFSWVPVLPFTVQRNYCPTKS